MSEQKSEWHEMSGDAISGYPSMRPSGCAWIGDVPTHWRVKRLKYVAPISDERAYAPEPDTPYVGLEHIESGTGRLLATKGREIAESVTARFLKGDVLFGKLRPYLAKVVRTRSSGTCSTELLVLRASPEIEPEFLCYQLLSRGFVAWINAATYGAKMPRANPERVANSEAALPPLNEQRAIVAFLTRETGKIDVLVAKKEELIKLLQEQRNALISHAVTKGLDPSAPMKDSGIEWLGEIPAHWGTSRTKFLCTRIVDGVHHTPRYVEVGVPFVTVKNLSRAEGISFDDLNYISEDDHREFVKRANPQRGDILLTKDGATLGIPRVVDTDHEFSIFVSVALMKLRTENIASDFMRFAIESCPVQEQLQSTKVGSALPHIHLVDLRNATVPIPPIAEQQVLANRLNCQLEHLQKVVARIGTAIERLAELRTSLISAAVTGKIDVRVKVA